MSSHELRTNKASNRIPPPARTGAIVRRPASRSIDQALEEMRATVDPTDTDETWQRVFRGIDEGRPDRKLFEGLY